jgi:hypothetical protein
VPTAGTRWRTRGAPSACQSSAANRATAARSTTTRGACAPRSTRECRSRPCSRSTGSSGARWPPWRALGKVLAYAFGEHVRELVRLEAGAHLVDVGEADVREVGIAFADLVGFTSLGSPRWRDGCAATTGRSTCTPRARTWLRTPADRNVGTGLVDTPPARSGGCRWSSPTSRRRGPSWSGGGRRSARPGVPVGLVRLLQRPRRQRLGRAAASRAYVVSRWPAPPAAAWPAPRRARPR